MTITPAQERYRTAYHEAGHVVAAYMSGMAITAVEMMTPDGELVDADAGWTGMTSSRLTPTGGADDVVKLAVLSLAGEATVRIAHASGMFPDAAIGAKAGEPDPDLFVDQILAAPAGSTLEETAVYLGMFERPDTPDEVAAQEAVANFCANDNEAAAMLSWLRARTAAVVMEPRFLFVAQRLAAALLELGSMTGEHVTHLLERWNQTYRVEEEVA